MKPAILIMGGYGYTGVRLAHHLLAHNEYTVVIAGRSGDKAEAAVRELNSKFPDGDVRAMAIDAHDRTAVTRALDGVRVLVNCATAKTIPPLVKCAVDAGVDWIDLQFSPHEAQIIRSYDGEARQRGVCIVTQGGFHPGLPACLVRYAASEMDTMRSGWVGSVIRPEGGLKFSDGIDELMVCDLHLIDAGKPRQ